jgi:hypothetical protein
LSGHVADDGRDDADSRDGYEEAEVAFEESFKSKSRIQRMSNMSSLTSVFVRNLKEKY